MAKRYKCGTGWFQVMAEDVDGLCIYPPKLRRGCDGVIFIDGKLKGKRRLGAIAHEWVHAEDGRLTEMQVDRKATVLTELLWDQGYRHTGEKGNGE